MLEGISGHCLCPNVNMSPGFFPWASEQRPPPPPHPTPPTSAPCSSSRVFRRRGPACLVSLHLKNPGSGWGWDMANAPHLLYKSPGHAVASELSRSSGWAEFFHPRETRGCLWGLRKTIWRGWSEIEWKELVQT